MYKKIPILSNRPLRQRRTRVSSELYKLNLLVNFDSGITGRRFWHGRPHLSKTIGILEENNIALVLNKLAFLEDSVNLSPTSRATI